MKIAAALLFALPLCGCFEDQRISTIECQLQATRDIPGGSLGYKGEHGAEMDRAMLKCMAGHGYDENSEQSKCQLRHEFLADPYCYTPKNQIERLIYWLETGSRPK
jgi:hypothetical protein